MRTDPAPVRLLGVLGEVHLAHEALDQSRGLAHRGRRRILLLDALGRRDLEAIGGDVLAACRDDVDLLARGDQQQGLVICLLPLLGDLAVEGAAIWS